MSEREKIVVTAYGHDKIVDKIAVSVFEETWDRYSDASNNAGTYCQMTNTLEIKGDKWINAKIISGNTPYSIDEFIPVKYSFADSFMRMETRAIQKVLREVDNKIIAIALKNANDNLKDIVLKNMTKHAGQMLKDDMECLGSVTENSIIEAQETITKIIRHLHDCGEIIIN
jgi:flagellar motor switch protein FliG